MRKISAHYIFGVNENPVKFGVISLNGKEVVSISQPVERLAETAQTEFYPGIIIPAIVNVATTNESIWLPKNDAAIEEHLKMSTNIPSYAVVTTENICNLSEESLQNLMQKGTKLVLGSVTDNHPVILFRLMSKLSEKLSELSFSEIVKIATTNGANALNQPLRGSINPPKQPGIWHISGFNFAKMSIDQNSKMTVLID